MEEALLWVFRRRRILGGFLILALTSIVAVGTVAINKGWIDLSFSSSPPKNESKYARIFRLTDENNLTFEHYYEEMFGDQFDMTSSALALKQSKVKERFHGKEVVWKLEVSDVRGLPPYMVEVIDPDYRYREVKCFIDADQQDLAMSLKEEQTIYIYGELSKQEIEKPSNCKILTKKDL